MSEQVASPRAPRVFVRRKTMDAWVIAHNPYPIGTSAWYGWTSAAWGDQADRAGRRSIIWAGIAATFSLLSLALRFVPLLFGGH